MDLVIFEMISSLFEVSGLPPCGPNQATKGCGNELETLQSKISWPLSLTVDCPEIIGGRSSRI